MTTPFSISIPEPALLESWLPELQWLDSQRDDMLRLLVRLCDLNFGTFNLNGLADVCEVLRDQYSALGGKPKVHDIDAVEFVDERGEVTHRPLGKLLHLDGTRSGCPTVLLCIHMDTVYPETSDFQKCTWLSNGKIQGPGVADAKGGLVVMLYALTAFLRTPLADRLGWEVIINPDEEIGSPGSDQFLRQRAKQAEFGLLFEPTLPNGDFVSSRKGGGNFSFVVRGRSAHSGREFEQGRNAIVCCCQIMNEIHRFNDGGDVTFNVGKISGGTALNVCSRPGDWAGQCPSLRTGSNAVGTGTFWRTGSAIHSAGGI